MWDIILGASAHHLLAFLTVGLLAAELALLRPGISEASQRQLGRIDLAYGVGFGVLVVVGLIRVIWLEKGWDYYSASPAFWAKMVLLAVITLCSLPPTVAYIGWGRKRRTDPAFTPSAAMVAPLRRWLWVEAGLLALVPIAAAMMARGY